MLRHIVMFRLSDQAEGKTKEENAKKIKKVLDKLPEKIEQIREYEVGINISESDSAADLVLISSFESEDELGTYRVHPDHIEALEFIKRVVSESRVVDYHV